MFTIDPSVAAHYDAFWQRDCIDRFLVYLAVGKHPSKPPRPAGASDEEYINLKWNDLDYRTQVSDLHHSTNTYYLDGFPVQFINFGPGSLAASIGGNYQLALNTVWFDRNPIITDWDNPPTLEFDPESDLWKKTVALTDRILQSGLAHTSVADLGGTMDILASLRGTENLLYDMYDYPEEVKAATKRINALWKHAYTLSVNRTAPYQEGTSSWMPVWCRQRYSPLQCDFSAMLSPDMFEEFVLPDLIDLTEFLDHSIYHMDGIGEIPHLDHLLSIPRLDAIQWTPGAGIGDPGDERWFEMYQRIQAAGKGLVLFVGKPDLVEPLIKSISPKGVFLSVGGCDHAASKEMENMIKSYGLGR